MALGRKEHLVQHYKGRHDKGESQTRCGKAQCSMARKGREGGESAGEGTQGLCVQGLLGIGFRDFGAGLWAVSSMKGLEAGSLPASWAIGLTVGQGCFGGLPRALKACVCRVFRARIPGFRRGSKGSVGYFDMILSVVVVVSRVPRN